MRVFLFFLGALSLGIGIYEDQAIASVNGVIFMAYAVGVGGMK